MGPHLPDRHSRWTFHPGSLAALIGALLMIGFVLSSYIQHDVIRMRGVVLSLILLGLAAVVQSESRAYVPVRRDRQ